MRGDDHKLLMFGMLALIALLIIRQPPPIVYETLEEKSFRDCKTDLNDTMQTLEKTQNKLDTCWKHADEDDNDSFWTLLMLVMLFNGGWVGHTIGYSRAEKKFNVIQPKE